jgi:hypothetical protein
MKKTCLIILLPALVAASLCVAAPAKASTIPTLNWFGPGCGYLGTMSPHFEIYAADRYTNYVETQRVWVRARFFDLSNRTWSMPTSWYYGTATDSQRPGWWWQYGTNKVSMDFYGPPILYQATHSGSYWVALQFAWDQGSTGAPAGGNPDFVTQIGICTF